MVVQPVIAAQVRSVVASGAPVWYSVLLQLVIATQVRSVVVLGAAVWYLDPVHVATPVQTVGPDPPSQPLLRKVPPGQLHSTHARRDVLVAGVDSRSPVLQGAG